MMGGAEFAAAILVSVVSSGITGWVAASRSSEKTVAAMGVHIKYLADHIERHERAIERAHGRIDDLEKAA